jgi:alpha-beta hydrolase superfamily lysophospholipase
VTSRISRRRAGLAALTLAPLAAWRFAHAYRARAGYPRQHLPVHDPSALGLAFERVEVPTVDDVRLPGWWIPAGDRAPAVLLVHGWESARDRTLPNAQILHALGFHVLTIDVRGHGENPDELLPLTAGEFGADSLAGVRWLLARDDVASVGVLGHSMGAIGAILAAAGEPRVSAVVAIASPADPYRLTRQTFHLASLPLPDVIAYPLAWLTTHVFLEPRGHTVADVSATRAIAVYRGPVLLINGTEDRVVPPGHLDRLAAAARKARADDPAAGPVEVLSIPGGHHSWLFEFAVYRATVGRFLAEALGGPLAPDEAARVATAVRAMRMPEGDAVAGFSALENEPGGIRTLVRAIATPDPEPAPASAGERSSDEPVGAAVD